MTMTEATGSGAARARAPRKAVEAVNRGSLHRPQPPAAIDAAIWPSIATVPSSLKARWPDALPTPSSRPPCAGCRWKSGTRTAQSWARPRLADPRPDRRRYPVMTINRPDAFAARLGDGGLIGLGESFMAGDWDADDLTAVMEVFAARVGRSCPSRCRSCARLYLPRQPRRERNTEQNTRSNISRHYDLSNELFATFLDSTMTYSSAALPGKRRRACGTWPGTGWPPRSRPRSTGCWTRPASDEGTRVLEIGTGWGELALRAAARGATVYSVTLSSEQQELARQRVAEAGYADAVTIELKDYRAVEGEYDAVVSVEMIEAVGFEYWATYFQTIERVLAPGGKVAIQAITIAARPAAWPPAPATPGCTSTSSRAASFPSVRAIEDITEKQTGLRVRERLAMGEHYAQTLRLWEERFMARADEVRGLGLRRDLPADVAVLPLLLPGRVSRPATSTCSRSCWTAGRPAKRRLSSLLDSLTIARRRAPRAARLFRVPGHQMQWPAATDPAPRGGAATRRLRCDTQGVINVAKVLHSLWISSAKMAEIRTF